MATRAAMENQDRLSNLPDCLLLQILSSLDTRQAVQTCVLSKRWTLLWTGLPVLNFDTRSFRKLYSFKRFIRYVLSRREPSNLHSLKLHWEAYVRPLDSRRRYKSSLNRVCSYAMSHSVQEIDICKDFFLSKRLACVSLRKVRLTRFVIYPGDFSNCVNLENLSLDGCHICGHVEVSAPRLSSFTFRGTLLLSSKIILDECPILNSIDIHLYMFVVRDQEKREWLKNQLQEVILHAKLLSIQMKTMRLRTILENDDIHAIIYNQTTLETTELFWKAAGGSFELFLDSLLQRCDS